MVVTMMMKDEWVQAAITDDNVVVELLLRLKQAQAAPSAPKSALKWGTRQRRSRPMLSRCYAKRDGGSPTTPLCWSGGSSDASPSSVAVDVFEETGTHLLRSSPVAPSRSKGSASGETDRTSTKRSRREKTFAELEEGNLLLKERVHLEKSSSPFTQRELASTGLTCKDPQASNESLKRIRLGLNPMDTARNSSSVDNESETAPHPRAPSSSGSILDDDNDHKPVVESHSVGKGICSERSIFVLPDLNMMPAEDDSGSRNIIRDLLTLKSRLFSG